MPDKKCFFTKAIVIAVLFLFSGISSERALSKTPLSVKGGTLIYGRGADSIRLDPASPTDGESVKILYHIFEGLVKFKRNTTEVIPALATSWEISKDGLIWTFNLRKGVYFHDGTPFSADAVIFSFARQMDPNHPYYRKFEIWEGILAPHIKEIKALDKYKIQITLKRPFAPMLSALAIYSFSIVSPVAMEKLGVDGFSSAPVGTGPFKLVEWIPDNQITLVANNDYWGKIPFIDKAVYKVIKNNSIRVFNLETGAVDVMDGIDPDSANKILRNSNLKLKKEPGTNVAYMAMNCERKPFTDKRVRQAINYAINKEPIIKLIYQDLAIPAKNPIPPNLLGYNENIKDYEYNPVKAKQLLAEAGYPDGFEFTLDVMENPRPYMPEPVKVAEAIKDNLSTVGIKVNLRINKWSDHLQRVYRSPEADYDATILGWDADYPDPDNFLYVLFSKDTAAKDKPHLNPSFYKNDEVHSLLIQAQQITNQEKRAVLYRKAQEIIHEDVPLIPLAHTASIAGFKNKIKDIYINFSNTFLIDSWIEEE